MTLRDEFAKRKIEEPIPQPITPKPKPNPNYDVEAEEWFSATNAEDDFESDVQIKRPTKWTVQTYKDANGNTGSVKIKKYLTTQAFYGKMSHILYMEIL